MVSGRGKGPRSIVSRAMVVGEGNRLNGRGGGCGLVESLVEAVEVDRLHGHHALDGREEAVAHGRVRRRTTDDRHVETRMKEMIYWVKINRSRPL